MASFWTRQLNYWRFERVGLGKFEEQDSAVPFISSDDGAPTLDAPDGSLFLRRDGANLTTVYARISGAWVAVDAGTNFGAPGISADVIAEATAAAGVTVDGLLIKDGSVRPAAIADPGNAGAIPVTASGICAITTAGAETRTLAAPSFLAQDLGLVCSVDGGTCVVTVASAINQTGNNTIALNDVQDFILLKAVSVAGTLRWRVVANDGAALTTV